MTRGNQRDLQREKAAKKQQELQKNRPAGEKDGNSGMTHQQRKERDADIMRKKQEDAAAAKKQQPGASNSNA